MLKILFERNIHKETLFLGMSSLLCFSLSIIRMFYTHSGLFLSLNWNLFLAFIPWALSSVAILKPEIQKSRLKMGILFVVWLIFFPNAPYILTDLFHLQVYSTMPLWFDLILILFFAWTGLLFGFFSLWNFEQILGKIIHKKLIPVFSFFLLFIGSFGVYLGRYLRLNSWDIISNPFAIFNSVGDRIINPTEHIGTWGMTILMGFLLNTMYWTFRLIKSENTINEHELELNKILDSK